jgi:hypothetical protein
MPVLESYLNYKSKVNFIRIRTVDFYLKLDARDYYIIYQDLVSFYFFKFYLLLRLLFKLFSKIFCGLNTN